MRSDVKPCLEAQGIVPPLVLGPTHWIGQRHDVKIHPRAGYANSIVDHIDRLWEQSKKVWKWHDCRSAPWDQLSVSQMGCLSSRDTEAIIA
jgi:hypothetical protein